MDEVVVVAVDATPNRWYTMILTEGQWHVETEGLLSAARDITQVEALAIAMAFDAHRDDTVIAVLGDNSGASLAFHKGFSSSGEIDKLIALHEAPNQVRILVDIRSEDNIADVGTRPARGVSEEEHVARSAASIKRAREALEVFEEVGYTYNVRPDSDSLQEED